MPSIQHEGLVEMFRQQPELAATLLHDELGVDLPGYRRAALGSTDLTDSTATELRANLSSHRFPLRKVVEAARSAPTTWRRQLT
jgi:hypothetical protein